MGIFLETKRLVVKTPELSDLDDLIKLRADPLVMRYVGNGLVQNKDEVAQFLIIAMEYYEKHGFGFCSVFEKQTGEFVGQAGVFHLGFQEEQDEIEIAYRLHQKFWGQGYATELARALIAWGFVHLPVTKLVAVIFPENIRSKRVLEKAGMTYRRQRQYRDKEVPCYEIYKDDVITLVPYDRHWPQIAETEIKKLREVLPREHILDIQHVGSTAIPNIQSKPIIDIQIAVDSLTQIKPIAIDALEKLGYVYWKENPDPERMFFVKGMPPFGEKRSHHIHIFEPTSRHWREKIQFRDYLLNHPDSAKEYEHLKIKLAAEYTYNREEYTQGKTKFINDILAACI